MKQETKKTKMTRYQVSVQSKGDVISTFTLEGVSDMERTAERFLDFFLIRRSAWFDINREDISVIKSSRQLLELPKNTDSEYGFSFKIKDQELVANFFPIKFVVC